MPRFCLAHKIIHVMDHFLPHLSAEWEECQNRTTGYQGPGPLGDYVELVFSLPQSALSPVLINVRCKPLQNLATEIQGAFGIAVRISVTQTCVH